MNKMLILADESFDDFKPRRWLKQPATMVYLRVSDDLITATIYNMQSGNFENEEVLEYLQSKQVIDDSATWHLEDIDDGEEYDEHYKRNSWVTLTLCRNIEP